MKVQLVNFRNQTQRETIENLLREFGRMIPNKVLQCVIYNWDHDDENLTSTASVSYDSSYHIVSINIYNKFFAQPYEDMKSHFIHEITHLCVSEFSDLVNKDMLQYIKEHNEPLAEQFRRQLSRAEESMVTQLEYFIMESISGDKRN